MSLHRFPLLLSILLFGCASNSYVATPNLNPSPPPVMSLEVSRPLSVSIYCMQDNYCKVSWHDPVFFADNVAIVYRNTVDDFDTAAEIGREDFFSSYRDRNVVAGTRYYYWVVFEDEETGERGPVSHSAFNSECVTTFTVRSCATPTAPIVETDPGQDSEDLEPEVIVQRLPFPRGASTEHHQVVKQPLLATEVQQAPVYHDGVHLFVGIDQGTEAMADMKSAGESQSSSVETVVTPTGSYRTSVTKTTKTTISERGEWSVRHGYFDERQGRGGAAEMLTVYLKESARLQLAASGTPVVMRFKTPPVVYFGGSAITATDADRLMRAVQLVNAALPLEWRMQIPSGLPTPAPTTETREGSIYVEFLPSAEYGVSHDPESLGDAGGERSYDGGVIFGTVTINKAYRKHGERGAVEVLAHELIHALGIGHIVSLRSIMAPDLDVTAEDMPLSLLYSIDREALQALYGRMQAGDVATDFGAWGNTTTHLVGSSDQAAFGVAWRNGYGEPWAHGYLPDSDLADNEALTGTATWEGLLLGFTPDAKPVAGDAELGVNLDDLTGEAGFTSLESWAAGEAPGDIGTGTIWGDGDLGYSIAVNGNTFRQTGGDDGILTGAFFGESHEGMGGTLERDDLTAAFGGINSFWND